MDTRIQATHGGNQNIEFIKISMRKNCQIQVLMQ